MIVMAMCGGELIGGGVSYHDGSGDLIVGGGDVGGDGVCGDLVCGVVRGLLGGQRETKCVPLVNGVNFSGLIPLP